MYEAQRDACLATATSQTSLGEIAMGIFKTCALTCVLLGRAGWAQEPLRIEPFHANQDSFSRYSGNADLLPERAFWSSNGLMVSANQTASMSVYDLEKDLERKTNLLWLHMGVILRGGSTRAGINQGYGPDSPQWDAVRLRNKELNEAWKKRTKKVMEWQWPGQWHEIPKAYQDKFIEKWWNDPKGEYKDPANYTASVLAVSPDLKYCYLNETDETRTGWLGPEGGGHSLHLPTECLRLNLETGERTPCPIKGTSGYFRSRLLMDISQDQRLLAVSGQGEAEVYQQEGYKLHRKWKSSGFLRFSPDSKRIVAFGDGPTVVWDIERDRETARIDTNHWEVGFKLWGRRSISPKEVFFSPDSRYLWLTRGNWVLTPEEEKQSESRGNIIWDLDRQREVKNLPQDRIERMEGWGPIPGTVLLGADDCLQLVDLATGQELAQLRLPAGSPPRRYRFMVPAEYPGQKPEMFRPKFSTMSRPDGFVVGGYEGRIQVKGKAEPQMTLSLISWHLGPHLEAIRQRMEALRKKR